MMVPPLLSLWVPTTSKPLRHPHPLVLLFLLSFSSTLSASPSPPALRDGDVIFQQSKSRQSDAVAIATGSRITHCGILFRDPKGWQVLEAVQPVKVTPLDRWIQRGKAGKWEAKRLKDADQILTPDVLLRMKTVGLGFVGKTYDLTFSWSDQELYCSELVWKVYSRGAQLRLTSPELLRSFHLDDPRIAKILRERYGSHLPLEDSVVSPKALHASSLLVRAAGNAKF